MGNIFRCTFHTKPNYKGTICITASAQYALYLNGKLLGKGPPRAWPQHFQFDTYDISSKLNPGGMGIHDQAASRNILGNVARQIWPTSTKSLPWLVCRPDLLFEHLHFRCTAGRTLNFQLPGSLQSRETCAGLAEMFQTPFGKLQYHGKIQLKAISHYK